MAQQVNAGYVDPTSAEGVEEFLISLWQRVLEVPSIDRDANFFELGGDSLIALEVVVTIEETLGTSIMLTKLYERPTVAELADLLVSR